MRLRRGLRLRRLGCPRLLLLLLLRPWRLLLRLLLDDLRPRWGGESRRWAHPPLCGLAGLRDDR